MNGGLTALLIFELAREDAPAAISRMTLHNVKPMFVDRPLTVCGRAAEGGAAASLWVVDHEGALSLSAEVQFANRTQPNGK